MTAATYTPPETMRLVKSVEELARLTVERIEHGIHPAHTERVKDAVVDVISRVILFSRDASQRSRLIASNVDAELAEIIEAELRLERCMTSERALPVNDRSL